MGIYNQKITNLQELYYYISNLDSNLIIEILYSKYLDFKKINKELFLYEDMSAWFTFLMDFEKALSFNVNKETLREFINSQITIYKIEHDSLGYKPINKNKIEKSFWKIIDNNILLSSLIKKHKLYILIHSESNIYYKGIFRKEKFLGEMCNIIHIYETDELEYTFILAHELGHYIFENICKNYYLELDEKERIADEYADIILKSIL